LSWGYWKEGGAKEGQNASQAYLGAGKDKPLRAEKKKVPSGESNGGINGSRLRARRGEMWREKWGRRTKFSHVYEISQGRKWTSTAESFQGVVGRGGWDL